MKDGHYFFAVLLQMKCISTTRGSPETGLIRIRKEAIHANQRSI